MKPILQRDTTSPSQPESLMVQIGAIGQIQPH